MVSIRSTSTETDREAGPLQSSFLAIGLANMEATIVNTMAATKMAEISTKPPNMTTRTSNNGPFKCLCAVSAATLLSASKLSLIRSIPSLHDTSISPTRQDIESFCYTGNLCYRLYQSVILAASKLCRCAAH